MTLINENNLQDKNLTNAEILALLQKLSLELDGSGFSRVLDVIEDLTGNRNFSDNSKVDGEIEGAKNSLALKVVKASFCDF